MTDSDQHRKTLLTLTLILLLGAALRWIDLGTEPFWFDEVMTIKHLEGSPWSVVKGIITRVDPPLYYAFMAGWIHAVGSSEFLLRLPSWIAGVACIWLIWRLASQSGSPATGLIAAALMAVHPMAIVYSQEARFYIFMVLLALLSNLALARLLRGERGGAGTYVLATAALFYMHFMGALLAIAQGLYTLVLRPGRGGENAPWKRILRLQLIIALLTLPYLLGEAWLYLFEGAGHRAWIGRFSGHPGLATLGTTLAKMIGITAAGHPVAVATWQAVRLAIGALGALGLALAAWPARAPRPEIRLYAAQLVVPPLLLALLSQSQSLYLDRYLIFCLPAAIALVASGFARLPRRGAALALGATLATLILAGFLYLWPSLRKADWPGLHARLAACARPGESLLVNGPLARPGQPSEGERITTCLAYLERARAASRDHGVAIVPIPYELLHRRRLGGLRTSEARSCEVATRTVHTLVGQVLERTRAHLWIAISRAPFADVEDDTVLLATPLFQYIEKVLGPARIFRLQRLDLYRFGPR